MPAIINYILYLALAAAVVLVFLVVYTRITPFDEFLLIRQGNSAAALSLGGALVGFSLTVASCIIHTSRPLEFLAWAGAALLVQCLAFFLTCRLTHMSKDQIEANNVAYGGLLGAISLSVGAINAACIS